MTGFRRFIEAKFPNGERQQIIKAAAQKILDAFRGPYGREMGRSSYDILADSQLLDMHKTIKDNLELIGVVASETTGEFPPVIDRLLGLIKQKEDFAGAGSSERKKANVLRTLYDPDTAPKDWYKSLNAIRHWLIDGHVSYSSELPSRRQDSAKLPHIFITSFEKGSILNSSTRHFDGKLVRLESYIEFTQDFIDGMYASNMSAHNYIEMLGKTNDIADWNEVAVFASDFVDIGTKADKHKDFVSGPPDLSRVTSHTHNRYSVYHGRLDPLPNVRGLFIMPFTEQSDALPIPPVLLGRLRDRVNHGHFSIINDFTNPMWLLDAPYYRGNL